MTERIITDSNGRKHITTEPLLHTPAQQQEPKLPEFYARFEDGLVSVYQRREDATPLLLLRENLPDKQPAQQEPVISKGAYDGAREDLAIWKKRALEAEALNRKFIADINGQTFMGEPAQQEPVAWKLVPTEPTEEMLKAMDECSKEGYDERLYAGHAASVYMAAIDAAPEQPAQQQEPVYWQWRRKDQPWSLEYTFNSEVQVTTKDSERRALYTSPQPAQQQSAERGEPKAYIHRQGNHWEVSVRMLLDDEKARGWTEEPLYTSPPAQRTPAEVLDWLADQHRAQCGEDRPIQEWIRKMKEMLP